jgi:hypothetical protein
MRLLERVLIDVIGRYFPDVDLQKLKLDLLHQRASLSNVNLAPAGQVTPTVFLAGLPFTLLAPSTLDSLDVWFDGGRLRAEASGLHLHLVHIPYERCAGNTAVNDAFARAKRSALAEAERQATGLFGQLLNKLLPVLMQKVQFYIADVQVVVELGGRHVFELAIDELRTANVRYRPIAKHETGGDRKRWDGKEKAPTGGSLEHSVIDGSLAAAGDLAKDVTLRGVTLSLGCQDILSLVECTLKLRYRLGEYDVELRLEHPLKVVVSNALTEALVALRRETILWEIAAKYRRPDRAAAETPAKWWRFAVRMLMRSTGCGHLSPDFGRSKLMRCVEYYQSHLERLGKGNRAGAATLERCRSLEDALDVETLIMLRSRARRSVRTETATRFAAEDWLGWMLVGDRVRGSDDERRMADDIREAVDNLEEAQDNGFQSMEILLSGSGGMGSGSARMSSIDLPKSASIDPTAWTQAGAVVHICSIFVSFHHEEDEVFVDLVVDTIRVNLEVDSGFSYFVVEASVHDFAISDGHVNYIRHVGRETGFAEPASGEVADPSAIESEPYRQSFRKQAGFSEDPVLTVELQSFPKKPGSNSTLNVLLGSLAVHSDVSCLSPILSAYARLQQAGREFENDECVSQILPLLSKSTTQSKRDVTVDSSAGSDGRSSGFRGKQSASTDWQRLLVLKIQMERLQLYFSSGLAVRDAECTSRDGLCFELTRVLCSWSPFKEDMDTEAHASCTLLCYACVMANKVVDGESDDDGKAAVGDVRLQAISCDLVDEGGFIRVLHLGEPFLRLDRVSLKMTSSGVGEVRFGEDTLLRLWDTEMQSLCLLAKCFHEELSSELEIGSVNSFALSRREYFSPPYTQSAWNRFSVSEAGTGTPLPTFRPFRVLADRLLICALFGPGSPTASFVAAVRGLSVQLGVRSYDDFAISVRMASLSSPGNDAGLRVAPADAQPQVGLSFTSQSIREREATGYRMERAMRLQLGSLELLSSAGHIVELSQAASRLADVLKRGLDFATTMPPSSDGLKRDGDDPVEEQVAVEELSENDLLEIGVQFVRIRLCNDDGALIASGNGLAVTSSHASWEGHMVSLELTEELGSGKRLKRFISPRGSAISLDSDGPRLHFTFQNAALRLRLSSLRVAYLRAAVERRISSLKAFLGTVSSEFDRFRASFREAAQHASSTEPPQSETKPLDFSWNFVGEGVLLVLPQSEDDAPVLAIDLHCITLASAAEVFSIAGRKIAILSSSHMAPGQGDSARVWKRILPCLDIDVQQSDSDESFIESIGIPKRRRKDEWKVELLDTPVVLLSPDQVKLILAVWNGNLSASDSIEAASEELVEGTLHGKIERVEMEVRSLVSSVYDRAVLTIVAPGLVIELMENEALPAPSSGIAMLTFGPVRYFRDVVSESSSVSSIHASSVTVMLLDIGWFRVDDRQSDVLDAFRFVVNVETSGDADECAENQATVPALHLSLHEKNTAASTPEAKTDVRIAAPHILVRPDLFKALGAFFSSLASPAIDGNADVDSGKGTVESEGYGELDDEQTLRKTSIVIVSPQVYMVEAPLSLLSRSVEVCAEELKVSLRQNAKGSFTKGSYARLRGLELSVCSAQVRSGPTLLDLTECRDCHEESAVGRNSLPAGDASRLSSALIPHAMLRHSIGSPGECVASALKCWAFDSDDPVVLLRLNLLHCRIPSVVCSALVVSIPSVLLDGTIRDLVALALIIPRLDLSPDRGATPKESEEGAPSSPPVDVSITDFEFIFRIPQHRRRDMRLRSIGDGSSLVRAKLALDVHLARNASSVNVVLGIHAVRSYDGQSGTWDRRDVLESSSLLVDAVLLRAPKVVTKCVRPVRMNLSPLIVKTLSHLAFSMQAAVSEANGLRGEIDSELRVARETNRRHHAISIHSACEIVEVCAVSEHLRVRASISDARVQLTLRDDNDAVRGECSVHVGDFIVKNEVLGRSSDGDVRDWSLLVSKMPYSSAGTNLSDAISASASVPDPLLLLSSSSDLSNSRGSVGTGRSLASAQPESNTKCGPESASFGGGGGDAPLLRVVLRFGGQGQHDFLGGILLSGLDVCLDADVVADLLDWNQMVRSTVADAQRLHANASSESRAASDVRPANSLADSRVQQRTPHLGKLAFLAPGIRFSARAPSSTQSSSRSLSLQRFVEVLVGSEYVSNVTLSLPTLCTDFRYGNAEDALNAVAHEYKSMMFSRHVFLQIARQSPALISLARVGMLAFLRRADTPQRPITLAHRPHAEGLLEVLDVGNAEWEHRLCIRERVSMLNMAVEASSLTTASLRSSGRRSGRSGRNSKTPYAVIDIANDAGMGRAQAKGALIYQLLCGLDERLGSSGERYSFFAQVDTNVGLLVTDKHLLIVRHNPTFNIAEPRFRISLIEGYSISPRNPRDLLIRFVEGGPESRRQPQDMFTKFQARAQSITPSSLRCSSPDIAEWLRLVLPTATNSSRDFDLPIVEEP